MEKPMKYFADLNIGDVFPQFNFSITKDMADKYLKTIENRHEVFENNDDSGKRLVPSTILSLFTFGAYKNFIESPAGCLHAKQEYEFLQPVYVGDTLVVRSKITDKYVKNGRNFVIFATEADKGNEPVLKSVMTILWVK